MIFLLAEKTNDIPCWFYLNNPYVKCISIPLPDATIRRTFIEAVYGNINEDVEETDEEIEFVNPGKEGQSVKLHIPVEAKNGWILRRHK